jgi:hypothetical protein
MEIETPSTEREKTNAKGVCEMAKGRNKSDSAKWIALIGFEHYSTIVPRAQAEELSKTKGPILGTLYQGKPGESCGNEGFMNRSKRGATGMDLYY